MEYKNCQIPCKKLRDFRPLNEVNTTLFFLESMADYGFRNR